MGLQTCHDSTAAFLNRGYETKVFTAAASTCASRGIRTTAHLILGLPGETPDMLAETIAYVNALPVSGVKLSMLHILKNTRLADIYAQEPFPLFTPESYVDCVISCLEMLRPDIVVERITGDGPRSSDCACLESPQETGTEFHSSGNETAELFSGKAMEKIKKC